MIGNDIVDLEIALKESNWRRPRFLQKVFTIEEQQYISAASDKDKAVWLLWSKKEAAYKVIIRHFGSRFFRPKDLVTLTNISDYKDSSSLLDGQVSFRKQIIHTTSRVTDTFIHTVAQAHDKVTPLLVNFFYVEKNTYAIQHRVTRQHLFENYSAVTGTSVKNLSIRKNAQRVPYLYNKDQRQILELSISHHGHYAGYVIQSTCDR